MRLERCHPVCTTDLSCAALKSNRITNREFRKRSLGDVQPEARAVPDHQLSKWGVQAEPLASQLSVRSLVFRVARCLVFRQVPVEKPRRLLFKGLESASCILTLDFRPLRFLMSSFRLDWWPETFQGLAEQRSNKRMVTCKSSFPHRIDDRQRIPLSRSQTFFESIVVVIRELIHEFARQAAEKPRGMWVVFK